MNTCVLSLCLAATAALCNPQSRSPFGPGLLRAAVDGEINRRGIPTIRGGIQEPRTGSAPQAGTAIDAGKDQPEPQPTQQAAPQKEQTRAEDSQEKDPQTDEEVFLPGQLTFREADGGQVLEIYQELSGRTILRPATLPQVKISLHSQTALSRSEAMRMLESALALNGIVLIPQGEKVVKAVPAGQAAQEAPAFDPAPAGALAESGSFMARVVKLNHKRPSDMAQAVQSLAKNPQAIVSIDAEGILVLRDHPMNIKRMLELIGLLDVPPESNVANKGEVLLLYLLASAVALIVCRQFLKSDFRGAFPIWLGAVLVGWVVLLVRFPQSAPDRAAGSALAWSAVGAGLFFVVLAPFLVRLYRAWIEGRLTNPEKAPGKAGIRAWLNPANVGWAASIALLAWLGFGISFWFALILLLSALLGYTFFTSPIGEIQTEPPDPTQDERSRALKLLEDGAITARECSNLLNALAQPGRAGPGAAWPAGPWQKLVLAGSALVLAGFFLPWFTVSLPTPQSQTLVVFGESDARPALGRTAPPRSARIQPASIQPPGGGATAAAGATPWLIIPSAGPLRGGNVAHGLGWFVLMFAIIAALLPWLADRWHPVSRRRLTFCCLGAGAVILVYLLTQNLAAIGFGFCLVLAGYLLEWIGTAKDRHRL